MTDREKAIVMAYTGVCMLTGDKINEFYKYLAELYERPVYTHEIATLDLRSKSKLDFVSLCVNEQPEQTDIILCEDCKYFPKNPRNYNDDDILEAYIWCGTEHFPAGGFCSCAKEKEKS